MLHLKTFGGLSVDIDGIPATGAAQQRKTLGLLALLAVAGERGLSRDKLIATLWPETDAEHGRRLLRQACYALRRDLGVPDLFLGTIQLSLNPAAISSDVESFIGALEANDPKRAVSCYPAPFLDGFYLNGGGEFEDWVETERARLAGRYKAALESLAVDATHRGEHRLAADGWRHVLELDPMSSRAALAFMTELDAAGERAEALRYGRRYGELVRSELGEQPPLELSEWMEQRHLNGGNGEVSRELPPTMSATGSNGVYPIPTVSPVAESFRWREHWGRALSLAAVIAVVALLAGIGLNMWRRTGPAAGPLAASGRKMLAVLPFENRGPAADDYFADGLTESIGLRLGGVRSLGIIAAQSTRPYKGTSKTLAQIGRELGVQYVLRGSVWWDRTGEVSRVRVSPTLVRVSDGRQLWAAEYDTVLAGMFTLQTTLASTVARALDIAVTTAERRLLEAPTTSAEAYDAFLQAKRSTDEGSGNPAGMRQVVQGFERAVALDSTFVTASAYLSIAHVIMYLSYIDRSQEQLDRGKAALDRVMRLDPNCDSGSCCALGFWRIFVLHDYAAALQTLLRARQVRPSDYGIYELISHVYRRLGQWDRALAYEQESERLNPLDPDPAGAIGRTYAVLRQFAAANYYLDRALAGTPQLANARLVKAMAYLNLTGDLAGARRLLPEVSRNISPTGTEDVVLSLDDIVLMLSDEQQTRLLRLTPAALDGDTAALQLAKALVLQRRHHPALARASFDSARIALEGKIRPHPDEVPYYHAMLGVALAGLDRAKEAVQEGERAVALLPYPAGGSESTLMPANLARIYTLLGEQDKAMDQLAIVFSRPGPLSAAWLRVDPFWDPLRANPQFQRMVAARN
jgi:TolB-like protein/DNA-binding SARP family transcriptional activator